MITVTRHYWSPFEIAECRVRLAQPTVPTQERLSRFGIFTVPASFVFYVHAYPSGGAVLLEYGTPDEQRDAGICRWRGRITVRSVPNNGSIVTMEMTPVFRVGRFGRIGLVLFAALLVTWVGSSRFGWWRVKPDTWRTMLALNMVLPFRVFGAALTLVRECVRSPYERFLTERIDTTRLANEPPPG